MAKKSISVDIAEGIGGPSATAVFREIQLPSGRSEQINILRIAIKILSTLGHHMSKCAVISAMSDGDDLSFRSVQIRGLDKSGEPILETGKNCGNSIVASTLVALREKYGTSIDHGKIVRVHNVDTDFTVDMKVVDFDGSQNGAFDMNVVSVQGKIPADSLLENMQPTWHVPFGSQGIPVTTLDIVNPYIIVPGEALGIEGAASLLSIEDIPGDVLDRLKAIRSAVINVLAYPRDSEFPKIAIAHREGANIIARTIYRQGWHPVLPITASISLAIASRINDSVIGFDHQSECPDVLSIKTPREVEKIELRIDPETGEILECVLKNRKAILHHCNVSVCF